MTFSRRFKDIVTFKMYNWHTVHGESIVEVSVRLLGVVFADFTRPTLFSKVMSLFMLRFTSVVMTGLCLAKIFYANSIGDVARVTETVMVGVQTINDQIFAIGLMHAKFADLYYQRKNFWLSKDIDPDDTCEDTKKQKLTLIFGNIFFLLLYVTYVCFILSYILFRELDLWVPESHPKVAFALSMYGMTWGIFSVTSTAIFNLLILSFCVEIQVQFQLINYRLNKMEATWQGDNGEDKAGIVKEIKKIVKHHSFLLGYWKELSQAFSLVLFIRIFEAVCVLCMGLFILTADETTSLYNTTRSIVLNGCLIMQLLLMVFSSETVEDEVNKGHAVMRQSSKVFESAYATPWNEYEEIVPYIKILMARAMSPVNLTAGGIVQVNKPLLAAIIKATFSYYTAMKTMAGLG